MTYTPSFLIRTFFFRDFVNSLEGGKACFFINPIPPISPRFPPGPRCSPGASASEDYAHDEMTEYGAFAPDALALCESAEGVAKVLRILRPKEHRRHAARRGHRAVRRRGAHPRRRRALARAHEPHLGNRRKHHDRHRGTGRIAKRFHPRGGSARPVLPARSRRKDRHPGRQCHDQRGRHARGALWCHARLCAGHAGGPALGRIARSGRQGGQDLQRLQPAFAAGGFGRHAGHRHQADFEAAAHAARERFGARAVRRSGRLRATRCPRCSPAARDTHGRGIHGATRSSPCRRRPIWASASPTIRRGRLPAACGLDGPSARRALEAACDQLAARLLLEFGRASTRCSPIPTSAKAPSVDGARRVSRGHQERHDLPDGRVRRGSARATKSRISCAPRARSAAIAACAF